MCTKNSSHILWIAALLITGCSMRQPNPAPIVDARPSAGTYSGEQLLQTGIKQYDDGQYKRATSSLLQSLEAGLPPPKRVVAHKHLAFIYCTSNRITLCRHEFGKALELDPRFDLAPAEAGHPQWGPVFRSVKSRQPVAS